MFALDQRERETFACVKLHLCFCHVKLYEYEERGCEFVHVSSRENEVCVYVCVCARVGNSKLLGHARVLVFMLCMCSHLCTSVCDTCTMVCMGMYYVLQINLVFSEERLLLCARDSALHQLCL